MSASSDEGMEEARYLLKLHCTSKDHPGILHKISGYLLDIKANITEASQFHDNETVRRNAILQPLPLYCLL